MSGRSNSSCDNRLRDAAHRFFPLLLLLASVALFGGVVYRRFCIEVPHASSNGALKQGVKDRENVEAGERKAFLVAADRYGRKANLNELPGAKRDVEDLRARLLEIGFEKKNVVTLQTGDVDYEFLPEKKKIENCFKNFIDNLKPEDFALVYLVGHGGEASKTNEPFFLPVDYNAERSYETAAVSIKEIMDKLARSRAKFRWLIVDACRSTAEEPTSTDARARAATAPSLSSIKNIPNSIVLMQSCSSRQNSYEGGGQGAEDIANGFFTLSLLEALNAKEAKADKNKDGDITFEEIRNYVTERTKELAKRYNKEQTPTYGGADITDFTFLKGALVDGLPYDDWKRANDAFEAAKALRRDGDYSAALTKIAVALQIAPNNEKYLQEKVELSLLLESPLDLGTSIDLDEEPDVSWDSDVKAGTRKVLKVNGVEYAFRYCPSGSFVMGSPENEPNRTLAEKQRTVTFNKGFWILETEITRAMYFSFILATGYQTKSLGGVWLSAEGDPMADSLFTWSEPGFPQTDAHPVTQVTLDDAKAFCEWLAKETALTVRLPNEEEWEYACRAGAATTYSFGDEILEWRKYANFADASLKAVAPEWPMFFQRDNDGFVYTAPVKSFSPNNWNIFDMHGNVREMCLSCADESREKTDDDFQFEEEKADWKGVARGGSWADALDWGRAAWRLEDCSGNHYTTGFRIVVGVGAGVQDEASDDDAETDWKATKAGERRTLTINGVECAFRYCPPGTFQMGETKSESEGARREVTLTNGFWMMETETTQALWKAVTGKNPSWFAASGGGYAEVENLDTSNFPVENVSWEDCRAFADKLNSSGAAPVGFKFELPTEAQWEYACRAGTTGDYNGADIERLGWYQDNSNDRTWETGTKEANSWGIFDMHGNVWEWCKDVEERYDSTPVIDPIGEGAQSGFRNIRGGAFSVNRYFLRSSERWAQNEVAFRQGDLGFRLILISPIYK